MIRGLLFGLLALVVAFAANSAQACSRCGLFGRACKFQSHAVVAPVVAAPVVAQPQLLVIQNQYAAPNGAAAPSQPLLAPQGNTVYGLTQAAQPYTLDPAAVLRQAAELTKGAQQLAQQGLNGYQQTASLALTLQATQPVVNAVAAAAPQQLVQAQPLKAQSQTLRLTQVNGQWKVEANITDGQPQQLGATGQPAPTEANVSEAAPISPLGTAGPLLKKHCASCHGLDNPTPAKSLYFDQGVALDCTTALSAIAQVNAGKMPKSQQLTAEERSALIAEISLLVRSR